MIANTNTRSKNSSTIGDAVVLVPVPHPKLVRRCREHGVTNSAVHGRHAAVPKDFVYLIASGLTGEPTAPVIGIAGATNRNS